MAELVARLETFKTNFDSARSAELEDLLNTISRERSPGDLIRLHETLLFLRAYP